MIFKIKDILAIKDFSEYIHWLHIEKSEDEDLSVTLGEVNNLWGDPGGSKIIEEAKKEGFFDSNGHFSLQFSAANNTAILFEIEPGYNLDDLVQLDRNIQVLILLTDTSQNKHSKVIYAFYMLAGQVLNIQGKKVKSRRIQNYLQSQPEDLNLRVMLLKQSFADWVHEYEDSDMLTAQEFSDYLKMPLGTFQNKLSKGEVLGPKKIDGSNRWQFKDIQDWVKSLSKTWQKRDKNRENTWKSMNICDSISLILVP